MFRFINRLLKCSLVLVAVCVVCFIPSSYDYLGINTVLAPEDKQPNYMVTAKNDEDVEPPVPTRIHSNEERIRFLLLGTDERKDEPSRSDTIILASYYPNEGKMNLLSIPRDTKVMIPGKEKADKINSAHAYGGMDLIKETVEDWSGLSIDHVAKVNFNGFKELIDSVDGVTVSPERAFSYGGDDFTLGEQQVNGKSALNYVRFRKDVDADFGRIKRQQEVIQATLTKGLDNFSFGTIPSYLRFYQKYVKTDMSYWDMYELAKTAHANGLKIEGKTLPTSSTKEDDIWYEVADVSGVYDSLQWLEKQPEPIVEEEPADETTYVEKVSGALSHP